MMIHVVIILLSTEYTIQRSIKKYLFYESATQKNNYYSRLVVLPVFYYNKCNPLIHKNNYNDDVIISSLLLI